MNAEGNAPAVEQAPKVETQTVEPKPAKPAKPAKAKVAKKAKGKPNKAKAATGKAKKAKGPAKAKKPAKASKQPKPSKGAGIAVPNNSPFRATSSYGKLWSVLFDHRDKGIRKEELVKEGIRIVGKPQRNILFDVSVVISPSKDGSAHRSANKAANSYWVERIGDGLLKLHLR